MSEQNKKISVSQLVFTSLYYRYNAFITPIATLCACFLLFLLVIMPEIQNFLATKDAITTNTQDLDVLKSNLQTITSLNDASLNQTLTTATSALPTEKDFAGILNALSSAAAAAGTSLGDYSFQIGDLSGLDQQGLASQLPLQLNVIVQGGLLTAGNFVTSLKNELPLSNTIALVSNANNTTTITVVFYYARLPKIIFQDTSPLPVLAKADMQLLQSLSASQQLSPTISSPSAQISQPLPTPTTITPTILPTLTPSPSGTSSAH